ncbi:hypothetical protein, partial [Salmonella sp. s54412]
LVTRGKRVHVVNQVIKAGLEIPVLVDLRENLVFLVCKEDLVQVELWETLDPKVLLAMLE